MQQFQFADWQAARSAVKLLLNLALVLTMLLLTKLNAVLLFGKWAKIAPFKQGKAVSPGTEARSRGHADYNLTVTARNLGSDGHLSICESRRGKGDYSTADNFPLNNLSHMHTCNCLRKPTQPSMSAVLGPDVEGKIVLTSRSSVWPIIAHCKIDKFSYFSRYNRP